MMQRRFLICFTIVVLFLSGCQQQKSGNTSEISHSKNTPPITIKKVSEQNTKIESIKQPKENNGQPISPMVPNQLWVPSVGIKAPVQTVGLLENGQMEVPVASDVAGVYIEGVLPGEKGNALIAGHLDNYKGPAIFHPLKKVKPGDPVVLRNEEGKYLVYSVVSIESYITSEAPLDRIFGDTDREQLNLITCAGKYDRQKKEHNKRLVVYTRLLK